MSRAAVLGTLALALTGCLGATADADLVLGASTSLLDAGLLDVLVPAFEADAGLDVRAVVGGTGALLVKAKRGDVDATLTHSPDRERALVAEGVAAERRPVLWNRFVIAGPAGDPAGVADAADAPDALRRIHDARARFASRGDDSGTHEREMELWRSAGLDPAAFETAWYKETGSGQAPTLLYAAERDAYLLVDEASLARFHAAGRAQGVVPLFATDDAALRNPYGVLVWNATHVPGVDEAAARAFADWVTGPEGAAVIAAYEVAGAPVFQPAGAGRADA